MTDFILAKFFEIDRWQYAIEKGVVKEMDRNELRRMMTPSGREQLLDSLLNGSYRICRPWTAKIPKDVPEEFRTVYVNNTNDRVFLSIVNDLLFDLTKKAMIHPNCMSYQRGVGCGKVVQRISKEVSKDGYIGYKADLSKYFDSVPREFIMRQFDAVEAVYGHSVIIDVLRDYYNNDYYWDSELKQEVCKYQSLKQGCAVASWLADVVLYPLDKAMDSLDVIYYRYSDDICIVGKEIDKAMYLLESFLNSMSMRLNPKKVEVLTKQSYFKFLGFSLRDNEISLSKGRIESFEKGIRECTIDKIKDGITYDKALKNVYRFLYNPGGEYSWASAVLPIVTNKHDVDRLNGFAMDCLRAVITGKDSLYGMGWQRNGKQGCIQCGKGKNVKANRIKVPRLDGYVSIQCMQNAMKTSMAAYRCLLSTLMSEPKWLNDGELEDDVQISMIEQAYKAYKYSRPTQSSNRDRYPFFYGVKLEELDDDMMLYAENRNTALQRLQLLVRSAIKHNAIPFDGKWFWQSENDRDLVILNL